MAKKKSPDDEAPQPATVTVRNIGKRLALVGESYLLEGEKREVSRALYEAAVAAGYELEIVE